MKIRKRIKSKIESRSRIVVRQGAL